MILKNFFQLFSAKGVKKTDLLSLLVKGVLQPVKITERKNTMNENLKIVDADSLLSTPIRKRNFIIDGLLPEGISILCGAPKIGKSWLMLWMCLRIAKGENIWGMKTYQCDVLYLCLEDSIERIQERLYSLTESAPRNLFFALSSGQIGNGLQKQIRTHIENYPKTKLIVIDTLQKIRGADKSSSLTYANDYEDITKLKSIADRYGIAIVVVHHLRKMPDTKDPFNQISGTTGITGATDTAFVITKENRSDSVATLNACGRDIEQQVLTIKFDNKIWHLENHKGQKEIREEEIPMLIYKIIHFVRKRKEWNGTATQLLCLLGETETSPMVVTKMLSRFYYEELLPNKIEYETKRTAQERLIYLRLNDSDDTCDDENTSG